MMKENTYKPAGYAKMGSWPLRTTLTFLIGLAVMFGSLTYLMSPSFAQNAVRVSAQSEKIQVGLNKSAIIRLPSPARDVLVGNPDLVDAIVRTKNTVYLFAKQVGETNAFFLDENGRQILNLDVEVVQDISPLQQLLRRTLPSSKIKVEGVAGNILLTGIARSPAEAQTAYDIAVNFTGNENRVVSSISITGKDQVTLKVRVAEVQRDALKQLGVDLNALIDTGSFAANLVSINPFSIAGPIVAGTGAALAGTGSDFTISSVVTALERNSLIKTLAEPNLTALSGESANFLAGGEFPVPVPDEDGISIQFKRFGIGLGFTPVVLSEGRISLKINTEVSEIDNSTGVTVGGVTVPGISVRRAETTLEIPSGGSMVLAGLIENRTTQVLNGVPGVKEVPVLGALFRSRDFQTEQSELAVIVTPYIATHSTERQLATPIDRLNAPNDLQTILFGRLNRIYGAAGEQPKGGYHGSVGFIVE